MEFRERLRLATKHAEVEYSQTAIAKSLGIKSKQTVDRWMGSGKASAEMVFLIEDKWGISARWLATGKGQMLAVAGASPKGAAGAEEHLPPKEQILLVYFRGLFSLQQQRLITGLRALFDANQITRKELGQKPLVGVSDAAIEKAYGPLPRPERGTKGQRKSGKALGDFLDDADAE